MLAKVGLLDVRRGVVVRDYRGDECLDEYQVTLPASGAHAVAWNSPNICSRCVRAAVAARVSMSEVALGVWNSTSDMPEDF